MWHIYIYILKDTTLIVDKNGKSQDLKYLFKNSLVGIQYAHEVTIIRIGKTIMEV